MTAVELLRRANARTLAAFVREGMEVPMSAATTLGSAWPAFIEELGEYGLRAEFTGDGYVIRRGKSQPIVVETVEAARR